MPVFLFLALSLTADVLLARPLKVVIDPGHGGHDDGAVHGQAKESDIVLKVALHLDKLLQQDKNFKSILTRTTDVHLPLPDRTEIADQAQADVFISIHANASRDKRARGVEFYFQNQLPPDEDTMYLASLENQFSKERGPASEKDPYKKNDVLAILEDLKKQYRVQSSLRLTKALELAWQEKRKAKTSIRQAPFQVISKAAMPSVLVEMGFLTHADDASRLLNPEYQKELARKIYRGLNLYRLNKMQASLPQTAK